MPIGPIQPHDATPEDLALGYLFGSTFRSAHDEVAKGGTIYGTPTINHGLILSGTTDHILYDLNGQFSTADPISCDGIFYPNFATDADARYRIFSSTGGNYSIFKQNNASANVLRIVLGGTTVASIPEATYGPLWLVGERNLITVAGSSPGGVGNTNVYFNGTQVVTADNTPWTPTDDAQLAVGATVAGADEFDGRINIVKLYNTFHTSQHHTELWRSRGMFE